MWRSFHQVSLERTSFLVSLRTKLLARQRSVANVTFVLRTDGQATCGSVTLIGGTADIEDRPLMGQDTRRVILLM